MPVDINMLLQSIAAIASCAAAVAAFRECKLLRKQIGSETYWQQNAKSVEYAQFFADSIIPKSSYIYQVTKQSEIFETVRSKTVDKQFDSFDATEFNRLTGMSPGYVYRRLEEESHDYASSFFKAMVGAHTYLKLAYPNSAFDVSIVSSGELDNMSDEVRNSIETANSSMLFTEFMDIMCKLLNELEFFAMAVNSGVADGEVVYPSLHQVFFGVTRASYWYICYTNRSGVADRYYTHVTTLYTLWMHKYEANQAKAKALDDGVNKGFQNKKERML